jgi:hypothetical protein
MLALQVPQALPMEGFLESFLRIESLPSTGGLFPSFWLALPSCLQVVVRELIVGIPLGGQPVKHQQLARQVGERVEDPPASSMASFQFTRSVSSQGRTFVFGSWVCITDGASNFHRFLVDMKPKTPTAGLHSNLDKFVDDLDDLSIHASTVKIEVESAPGATSSGAAVTSFRLDSFQSKDSRSQSRLGSRNLAIDLQEADISESLYALQKDLDSLLQLGGPEATACRGASGCFCASDLMITSTPEGCFVHWRGMKLSDLLEAEDRLVAHLEPLPFQEGRPLATVAEESTELVDVSSDELVSRQVLMVEEARTLAIFPSSNLMRLLR